MVQYKPLPSPLTEDDLPETDNQPVDNDEVCPDGRVVLHDLQS